MTVDEEMSLYNAIHEKKASQSFKCPEEVDIGCTMYDTTQTSFQLVVCRHGLDRPMESI